jgi:hypothetical protein
MRTIILSDIFFSKIMLNENCINIISSYKKIYDYFNNCTLKHIFNWYTVKLGYNELLGTGHICLL